jgi:hypothetical protein
MKVIDLFYKVGSPLFKAWQDLAQGFPIYEGSTQEVPEILQYYYGMTKTNPSVGYWPDLGWTQGVNPEMCQKHQEATLGRATAEDIAQVSENKLRELIKQRLGQ